MLAGCLVDNPAWLGPTVGSSTTQATDTGTDTAGETGTPPEIDVDCPARPGAVDAVTLTPGDIGQLVQLLAESSAGTTIALADGVYDVASLAPLRVDVRGLVLRSASGDPTAVVLEGGGASSPLFEVRAADVEFAELTIRGGAGGAIHAIANGNADPDGLQVYRVEFIDVGNHAVRGAGDVAAGVFADGGEVACSRMVRQTPLTGEACSGMSALRVFAGADWVFRNNEVQGYWCDDDGSPPRAVALLDGTRGSVVVRNRFRNCARAVVLGEQFSGDERRWSDAPCTVSEQWGHVEGLIANNTIWVGDPGIRPDSMISAWNVCNDRILHNTIVMLGDGFHGIEHRFDRTRATIINNLSNADVEARDGSGAIVEGNLLEVDLDQFVDALAGDVHLQPDSIAVDAALANLGDLELGPDFEGDPRDEQPDVGADELRR